MIADFEFFYKFISISVIFFSLNVVTMIGVAVSRSRLKELAICSFSVTSVFSSFLMLAFVLFPSMSEALTKVVSVESLSLIRHTLKATFDAELLFPFFNMASAFSMLLFSICSCALTLFMLTDALVFFGGTSFFVFTEKKKVGFSQAAAIAERKLFYIFSKNLN